VTQTNNQAAYGAQLDLLSAETNSRKALASPSSGTPSSDRTAKPPDVTAAKPLEEALKPASPEALTKDGSPNAWSQVRQTSLEWDAFGTKAEVDWLSCTKEAALGGAVEAAEDARGKAAIDRHFKMIKYAQLILLYI